MERFNKRKYDLQRIIIWSTWATVVILVAILMFGCSAGLYGGIDTDLYYSDHGAITGKPLGDPWRSRGSGKDRQTSTEPKVGFAQFSEGSK